MVVPFLIFCRTCIPFSTVAVPMIYQQCTNSAQRFPFLDNLAKLWYLLSFDVHSGLLTGVRWHLLYFWCAFLWWLLILSFFWCTCWPLVTSVLKTKQNVYLYHLTIFKSDCFHSWVVWLLHIFWILIPYQIYGSHTFSPSVSCLFVLMVLFAIQYFSSLM